MITIGIVGVVAALTIPTLIQNSNSKKFSTQFKKELSTLNQAAISAQAQYDMDYGSISSDSDPSTCASDTFSASQSTMCALFNSTLSAKNYMGVYGQAQGYKTGTTYSFTKTTEGFDPANFLLYTLADGSIVGFNPNAKRCSLESGQTINNTVLTDSNGLANCIGFIDVNGVSLPNKEVTCADGTSSLDVGTACTLKTTGSKIGDVYPIVFHNGTVEPATNAGFAQFGAGKGDGTSGSSSSTSSGPRTVNIDGVEYKYLSGKWYHEDGQGNIVDYNGNKYTKTSDGYERTNGSYKFVLDNNLNPLGQYYNGTYYEYKGSDFVRDAGDGTGNLVNSYTTYIKTSDGYERTSGSTRVVYDNNLNPLGQYYNGTYYELTNGGYLHDPGDGTGNLVQLWGDTYIKTSDGYERTSGPYKYVYDKDLNHLGRYEDGTYYEKKRSDYVRDAGDGTGNLVTSGGTTYTKRDDGLYQLGSQIYDENLNRIK